MTTSTPHRRLADSLGAGSADRSRHDQRTSDGWLRSHRSWLGVDAVVTGVNGVGYLALASVLDGPLGLSAGALRTIGAGLTAFAVLVAITGARRTAAPRGSTAIITVNAIWVIASLAVAVIGPGDPSIIGRLWIVAQALVVGAMACGQSRSLTNRGDR